MGLTDHEVRDSLSQMVSFINAEAREKAAEIRVKGEDEFAAEKATIFQEEKDRINREYERKHKQVSVSKRIAYSNALNSARLAILEEKDVIVKGVLNSAKEALAAVPSKPSYGNLLQSLITEAVLYLKESNITVQCRKQDVALVQAALAPATSAYAQLISKQAAAQAAAAAAAGGGAGNLDIPTSVNISLHSTHLGDKAAGGVIVYALGDRLKVDNTLEARLDLAFEAFLPSIRSRLFGSEKPRPPPKPATSSPATPAVDPIQPASGGPAIGQLI